MSSFHTKRLGKIARFPLSSLGVVGAWLRKNMSTVFNKICELVGFLQIRAYTNNLHSAALIGSGVRQKKDIQL